MWWDWLWWYCQPEDVDECDPSATYEDYNNPCNLRFQNVA